MLVVLDELHACGPPTQKRDALPPHQLFLTPLTVCGQVTISNLRVPLKLTGGYIDMPIPSQDHKVHPLATVYWV